MNHLRARLDTTRFHRTNELLCEEPAEVRLRNLLQLVATEQAYHALARTERAALDKCVDGSVLRASEHVCLAKANLVECALREELHAEAALAIDIAVLVREVQVQLLIDNL